MANSPPKSPSDYSLCGRPSSVPLLGASTKLNSMRKQFNILPNRMSVSRNKELLQLPTTPARQSPKPDHDGINRPQTSLGFTTRFLTLFSREKATPIVDIDSVLNRPQSMIKKITTENVVPAVALLDNRNKEIGDINGGNRTKNVYLVGEKALEFPSSSSCMSPMYAQNATIHELDRELELKRAASRLSSDAIEMALSDMEDDKRTTEETALSTQSPPLRSLMDVSNAEIKMFDRGLELDRTASQLSTDAIKMALGEMNDEMYMAERKALNSPQSAHRSLVNILNAVALEHDKGLALEREASRLSIDAIDSDLSDMEDEAKSVSPPTVSDAISAHPKNVDATMQLSTLPIIKTGHVNRPYVVQRQLFLSISKDLCTGVVASAMVDIEKEIAVQNGFIYSSLHDMAIFVPNKPFVSQPVSHFKLSKPAANPPTLNNRILLALAVDLCKDVIRMAVMQLQSESDCVSGKTTPVICAQVPSLKEMCQTVLPKSTVKPSSPQSVNQVLSRHAIQENSNKKAQFQSLKELASNMSAQHDLLIKPANEYQLPAALGQILPEDASVDSSNNKAAIPSLKDLAAKMAAKCGVVEKPANKYQLPESAQYGLQEKPANKYQLPAAKLTFMKKKLTPSQKILLERPGWIKHKRSTKQSKLPLFLDKNKSTTSKKAIDKSSTMSDQKNDKDKQSFSSDKAGNKQTSDLAPRTSKVKAKSHNKMDEAKGKGPKCPRIPRTGNAGKEKPLETCQTKADKSKSSGRIPKTKERRKLIKNIENGQHVGDRETVSLLMSVVTGDEEVEEMLKEIDALEALAKDIKENKSNDGDGNDLALVNKRRPSSPEKNTSAEHVVRFTKAAIDQSKPGMKTATEHVVQLTKTVADQSKSDVEDDIVTDVPNKKRKKKKLSVNKEPDIVPRMNKHVIRMQEEKAKNAHRDGQTEKQGEGKVAMKKRPKIRADAANGYLNPDNEAKIRNGKTFVEPKTPRSNREPLRPVRATKATEARLKHVERMKEEAALKERLFREERQRDVEIQKAREISRARALDPVRAKRRQQFSERKPWDPLPPKKMARPVKLPAIRRTNDVVRHTRGGMETDATGNDIVKDRGNAGPPLKTHRRVKASIGGLMIARM